MHPFNPRFLALLLSLGLSAVPHSATAITRTWPGAAPCNTTLQACIGGAIDGDRIEIATETPINESPNLYQRTLELVAANGYRPRLADNQNIFISSAPISGNQTVLVDGLRLRNGYVSANYLGYGTANYTIQNMKLETSPGSIGGRISSSIVRNSSASGTTLNLTLYNNEVVCGPAIIQSSVISMTSEAATTLNANVYNNKVTCSTQDGVVNFGIRAYIGSNAAGVANATLKFHGNEVRAERYTGGGTMIQSMSGIGVQENATAQAASNITARFYSNVLIGNGLNGSTNGIAATVDRGDMSLQMVNNTVTGWYRSLYASSYQSPGTGTQNIDGLVVNNLMVSYGPAFFLQATTTASLSNGYNLVNAPALGTTLGANSITAPARLVSESMPRLRADSPAIGAADTATLGFGIVFNALPSTDADGLRRIKGAGGDADIGAYEFGDVSFEHRVTGTGSNNSRIYSPALDGNFSALAQAGVVDSPQASSVTFDRPFGLYYATNAWRVFDQSIVNLDPGTTFSLFAPATGGGLLRHIATPASITSYYTRIENSSVDNRPELILLATQNWNPNLIYNAHPISVGYGGTNWYVDNIDRFAMPPNAAFNLYWQNASPNAFRVRASASNILLGAVRVDHPLLDGHPCARPHATRITFGSAPVNQGWEWTYLSGNWYLFDFGSIPIGTQFNVVVDPAQVALCSDRIFAHDF